MIRYYLKYEEQYIFLNIKEAIMAGGKPKDMEDLKHQIKVQLADLSRLLGQMSNEDAIVADARTSFLTLSALISRALDIQVQ
jgi:hypothetical protein